MREFVTINHSVQLLICKTWSWDCFWVLFQHIFVGTESD